MLGVKRLKFNICDYCRNDPGVNPDNTHCTQKPDVRGVKLLFCLASVTGVLLYRETLVECFVLLLSLSLFSIKSFLLQLLTIVTP